MSAQKHTRAAEVGLAALAELAFAALCSVERDDMVALLVYERLELLRS